MMQPPEVPPFLEHVAPSPRAKVEKLPADVETAVRKAVYDKNILVGTEFEGPRAFIEQVAIPGALTDAYAKYPAATIEYLLSITEKAEPYDSMKAAAYTISLIKSPGVGTVVVRRFEKSKYDVVDPAWRVTPREHWIGKIKADMASKK
jgi:hypothetical protein